MGYAICQPGECYIEIATLNRSEVEICATLVHEAAHLENGCTSETIPRQMHEAFLEDYYARAEGGELVSKEFQVAEISVPGLVQDFYPLAGSASVALIVEDSGDGFQSSLYVHDTDTGFLEQISPDSGKKITFARLCSTYYHPVYLNQLKNPWSSSGRMIAAVAEDREGNRELRVFDRESHAQQPIVTAKEFSGAIFSPDEAYLAVSTADFTNSVRIFDPMSGETVATLPSHFTGESGAMVWTDSQTLAVYIEHLRQIQVYDMESSQFQTLYSLSGEELSATGLHPFGNDSFCAVISTSGSEGFKKILRISINGSTELLTDSITGNSPPALSPGQDSLAVFTDPPDSREGDQLLIRNLLTGAEQTYLDRFTEKGAVFWLFPDRLLVSTVRMDEEDFRFDYRVWLLRR
ncbi:MAG: WD40 repeat domain-containing protein [Desulfobacterales bacterium]